MNSATHAESISLSAYKWRGIFFTQRKKKERVFCIHIHSTHESENLLFYSLPVLRDSDVAVNWSRSFHIIKLLSSYIYLSALRNLRYIALRNVYSAAVVRPCKGLSKAK